MAAAQAEAQRIAAEQAQAAYTPPVEYTSPLDYGTSDYSEPVYTPPADYSEPTPIYPEPAYTPPVEYYPEPTYSEPVYSPPAYAEPAYTPPVEYAPPVYSEPAYVPPVEYFPEPAYAPPVEYAQPTPIYPEPVYSEPAPIYSEPVYSEPAYTPTYTPPVEYSEPAYTPPVEYYSPLDYGAPDYSAPVDYSAPASYPEQTGAPVSAEPVYTPPTDYSSLVNYTPPVEYPTPVTYAEQTGAPVAVEPDYSAPATYAEQTGAPVAAEPYYSPPAAVEQTGPLSYAEQTGMPTDVGPDYSSLVNYPEQVGAPAAVEPVTYAEQTGTPVAAEPVAAEPYASPLEQAAQTPPPLTYEEREARRIAANTPPEGTFITAPLSNTGEATGFGDRGQTNAFQYWGGPIRVTDRNGKVLFSGEGPEAAVEAVKFAQNLSDTKGANAAWDIQQGERTINPDGSVGEMRWISGPSDAKDGRGIIGDIGGFLIPALTALATGGLSVPAQIAAAAAAGAAGNAFADKDPLKGAVMGALTTVGGKVLGPVIDDAADLGAKAAGAIGTGLGATAGGLATGQPLQNALLGGLASGASAYLLPGVAEEIGLTKPWTPSSPTGGDTSGAFDGNAINVTGGTSTSGTPVSINGGKGSAPSGDTRQDVIDDGIVVSGAPPVSAYTPVPGLEAADTLGLTGAQLPPVPETPPETPPEELINVTGAKVPPLSLPASIFTGQPQAVEPVSTDPKDGGLIDVIAPRQPSLPIPAPTQGGLPPITNPLDTGLIDVIAPRQPSLPIPVTTQGPTAADTLGLAGAQMPPQPETLPEERDIVVSGSPTVSTPVALPGVENLINSPEFQETVTDEKAPEPERNRLKDIIDYLRLAGLATSTLGALFEGGGGGGGSKFRVPVRSSPFSSVFSAKLPPPNLPGGVGGGGTGARPPSDLAVQGLRDPMDYYRYGYGPEQSFFNYVPQGAPNRSRAYTGYARGGFAVEGPGDGRDDKIPALLSDGEYVMDAETVALLGNGSNKAGAKMLDKFRVNVRKQKGRKLARGEFSAKAKRPEHYMAGGRT